MSGKREMLKLRLLAGDPDRLARLLDTSKFEVEVSRMDESREERDDSPANETEVTRGDTDD